MRFWFWWDWCPIVPVPTIAGLCWNLWQLWDATTLILYPSTSAAAPSGKQPHYFGTKQSSTPTCGHLALPLSVLPMAGLSPAKPVWGRQHESLSSFFWGALALQQAQISTTFSRCMRRKAGNAIWPWEAFQGPAWSEAENSSAALIYKTQETFKEIFVCVCTGTFIL